MSQELQYLRDEINQSLRFLDEHPQKTIIMVLLFIGSFRIALQLAHWKIRKVFMSPPSKIYKALIIFF